MNSHVSAVFQHFGAGSNPLTLPHFPRNFQVDGEAANLLRTCYEKTGVMDFGLNTT